MRWFWLWPKKSNKTEFENDIIETIYFGGGTPSVLSYDEINFLIDSVLKIEVGKTQKSHSKPILMICQVNES
jgi:hypothetical protein